MSDIVIDYQCARLNMVESQIKSGGVRDVGIWDVMSQIPRELFVDADYKSVAYMDNPVPLSSHRAMLSPLTCALLIELAHIEQNDLILDIACGAGYSTAILAALGSAVVGVEQDTQLVDMGTQILQNLGVDNGVIVNGAHCEGQTKQSPYNAIIINGFVPYVPENLLAQLADKGRLVCVTEVNGTSCGVVYQKTNDGITSHAAFEAMTVTVPGFEKEEVFSF